MAKLERLKQKVSTWWRNAVLKVRELRLRTKKEQKKQNYRSYYEFASEILQIIKLARSAYYHLKQLDQSDEIMMLK